MKNGKYEEDGRREWYLDGKLHREDGPAYEAINGIGWFLNGKELTEEEFKQWTVKKELNEKLELTLVSKSTEKRLKI